MATRRLTINLFDFTDQAVGIPVTIQLEGVTQAAAEGALPNRYIIPHAQTAHTNKDGVAVFDIEPTQNLQGNPRPQYRVSWVGGPHAGLLFNMPDAHSSLYTIVQQPTIPPDPGTLPVNPQEGDYIVFSNSQWQLGSPSHVGTSPPQAPAQGGLWFDTSSSPADIRWYNAGRWEEVRDPADIAAALNSLTGPDRVSGRHIADQIPVPLFETLPGIEGYEPGDYIGVQAAGQTASVDVYILSRSASRTLTDRNRLQFVIDNNVVQATPPATDNYRGFLGSIVYRTVGRDSELSIRLDTGLGVEVPDQLWLRGIEAGNVLSEFRVDIAQPYSYSGGRRYKQLNNLVSQTKRAAGINGPQTWLLFDDLAGTSPFQFKPATERIGSRWVGLGGGGSPGMGGGLNQAQVDARIQIGVADWAETGNTDDIPAAKLPPIGTSELANDAVTQDKIADNAVGADQIATGAVGGTEIAPDSVGTSELANNAVTNIKMADDAIGSAELAANAVDTAALADDAVTPAKLDADNSTKQAAMRTRIGAEASGHTHPAGTLPAGSVGTAELADDAVTQAKIAASAVGATELAANAVRSGNIVAGAVTSDKIPRNAIGSSHILDRAITGSDIATGAIASRNLGTGSIDNTTKFSSGLRLLLLPSGGTVGQVLQRNSTTNLPEWVSGDVLTQAEVDARIAAFARAGNTDLVPVAKLAAGGSAGQVLKRTATGTEWAADAGGLTQTQVDGRVTALVEDFAEVGNAATIPTGKIANDAVTAAKINTGAVGASELAAGAVGTGAIANDAVTTAQLADDAVEADQLAANAVVTASIVDDAVTLDKIANAVTARLLPAGGTEDQALIKSSDSDYATEWGDVAAGSGGTPLRVTPQELTFLPSLASTNIGSVGETQLNIVASSTLTGTPFSVTSNGIVVAAGTAAFQGTLDYVLEIDPTGWSNSLPNPQGSGGNRLFIDVYWKRDGTILPETRQSHYIRGDEDWAPSEHKIHGIFTERLVPGTYTLWLYRPIAAGGGNEIQSIQIASANSDIKINYEVYSGGGGSGAETFLALTDTPAAFGTAGQSLRVNTGTNALEFYTPAAGGLDQAAVDARVSAGTKVFARTGGRAIQGSDIGTGQVSSAQIADATIVSGDIAANSITGANIAPNAIGASELADNAVDSGAIAANAVTAAKIASNAVGATELADNAVDTAALADDAVTQPKIGAGAVGATELAANAVTAAKIAAGAVGSSEIATNAVTATEIANATIVAGNIAANTITAAQLAANSVGASELADNAVDAGAIAANAVTAAKIASNAVTTAKIGNDQVTIDKIADAVVARLLPSTGGSAGQVLTWPQTGSNPAWAAAAGGGGARHVVSAWDAQAVTQIAQQQTSVLALTYESSRTLTDYDYLEVVVQGPQNVDDTFFWIPVVTLTNIGTSADTFSRVAVVVNRERGSTVVGTSRIEYAHGGTMGSRIRGHPRPTSTGGSGSIWETRIRYCALVRFS